MPDLRRRRGNKRRESHPSRPGHSRPARTETSRCVAAAGRLEDAAVRRLRQGLPHLLPPPAAARGAQARAHACGDVCTTPARASPRAATRAGARRRLVLREVLKRARRGGELAVSRRLRAALPRPVVPRRPPRRHDGCDERGCAPRALRTQFAPALRLLVRSPLTCLLLLLQTPSSSTTTSSARTACARSGCLRPMGSSSSRLSREATC